MKGFLEPASGTASTKTSAAEAASTKATAAEAASAEAATAHEDGASPAWTPIILIDGFDLFLERMSAMLTKICNLFYLIAVDPGNDA